MNFTGVQLKNIPKVWLAVAPLLRQGLAEGETLEQIKARLDSKECQLWIVYEGEKTIAACVTEIVTIGERKVCNIITIGGSRMDEWLHNLNIIEIWAKSQDVVAMRFPEIRTGWAKILKDYTVTKILMEKVL